MKKDKKEMTTEIQEEKIATYSPTIDETKPIKLKGNKVKLFSKYDNGFIPTTMDSKVMIQRVSRQLYQKPTSGVRELYANERRACSTAMREHNATPIIEIRIDPINRKLVIHGIDSMGISPQRFEQVVTVLGKSDNFDSSEAGMFGMGIASYTTLGDIMIMDINSREKDVKYTMIGLEGQGWQEPKEDQESTDLEAFGTRVKITLRDGISLEEIVDELKNICRYSEIETYLILESDIDRRYGSNSDKIRLEGRYKLAPNTPKQFITDHLKTYKYDNEVSVIEIDNENFYLYAVALEGRSSLGFGSVRSMDIGKQSYILNLPIQTDTNESLGSFSAYVLNIKNERMFMPTPDRERLSDEADKKLQKLIEKELNNFYTKNINVKTIADYMHSPYRVIVRNPHVVGEDNLPLPTIEFKNFLEVDIGTGKDKKSHAQIIRFIDEYDRLFWASRYNTAYITALEGAGVENPILIKPIVNKKNDRSLETIKLLEEYQIRTVKGFLKSKGIKLASTVGLPAELVIHSSQLVERNTNRYHSIENVISKRSERIKSGTMKADVIKIPEDGDYLKPVLNILSNTLSKYHVVKEHKAMKTGIPFGIFLQSVQETDIKTNKGNMKIKDLEIGSSNDLDEQYLLLRYPNEGILSLFTSPATTVIIGNSDTLFEAGCHIISKGGELLFDAQGIWLREKNQLMRSTFGDNTLVENKHLKEETMEEEMYSIFHVLSAPKNQLLKEVIEEYLRRQTGSGNNTHIQGRRDALLEIITLLDEKIEAFDGEVTTFMKSVLEETKNSINQNEKLKTELDRIKIDIIGDLISKVDKLQERRFMSLPTNEKAIIIQQSFFKEYEGIDISVKTHGSKVEFVFKQKIADSKPMVISNEKLDKIQEKLGGYSYSFTGLESYIQNGFVVTKLTFGR